MNEHQLNTSADAALARNRRNVPRTPEGRVARIIDGLTPSAAYVLDAGEALDAFRADLKELLERPTVDAWRAACRALNWRTVQLRAHGVVPVLIAPNAPHYPPDDFQWAVPLSPGNHPERICSICDGGPGNSCAYYCGMEKWEAPAS